MNFSLFPDEELLSDDESNSAIQLNHNRISISPDGIISGSPVQEYDISEFNSATFSTFRNKSPVIIKSCCSNWDLALQFSASNHDIAQFLVASEEADLINAFVATDNTNFLRHELCVQRQISISHFLNQNFNRGDDEAVSDKTYCRLYLNDFPDLQRSVSFDYLESLAKVNSEEFNFKTSNIGLWLSSKQCITPLHFDLCQGFLNQIKGKKRFILASPSETSFLYWKYVGKEVDDTWLLEGSRTNNGTSSSANFWKYLQVPESRKSMPLLDEVQWWVADLEPGGTLYTPPGWWHLVESKTSSVSLLVPFDPIPSVDVLPFNVLNC